MAIVVVAVATVVVVVVMVTVVVAMPKLAERLEKEGVSMRERKRGGEGEFDSSKTVRFSRR